MMYTSNFISFKSWMKLRTKSPKRWQFLSLFRYQLWKVLYHFIRNAKIGKLLSERTHHENNRHLSGKLCRKSLFHSLFLSLAHSVCVLTLFFLQRLYSFSTNLSKVKCSLKLNDLLLILSSELWCAVCSNTITMHNAHWKLKFTLAGCCLLLANETYRHNVNIIAGHKNPFRWGH